MSCARRRSMPERHHPLNHPRRAIPAGVSPFADFLVERCVDQFAFGLAGRRRCRIFSSCVVHTRIRARLLDHQSAGTAPHALRTDRIDSPSTTTHHIQDHCPRAARFHGLHTDYCRIMPDRHTSTTMAQTSAIKRHIVTSHNQSH